MVPYTSMRYCPLAGPGLLKTTYPAHIPVPDVIRFARGAHRIEVIPARVPLLPRTAAPRGKRQPVRGFSSEARRRLLALADSIAWPQVPAGCVLFVTLTYPSVFPAQSSAWRKHLRSFQRRLERQYGKHAVIWKLESQGRTAPHWHLVLFASASISEDLAGFRGWVADAWAEVCGTNDPAHRHAGTRVQRWKDWGKHPGNAVRYLAKSGQQFADGETGEALAVGRLWGKWNATLLPLAWHEVKVPRPVLIPILRVLRKLFQRRSSGRIHRISGRLSAAGSERLVEWALGEVTAAVSGSDRT